MCIDLAAVHLHQRRAAPQDVLCPPALPGAAPQVLLDTIQGERVSRTSLLQAGSNVEVSLLEIEMKTCRVIIHLCVTSAFSAALRLIVFADKFTAETQRTQRLRREILSDFEGIHILTAVPTAVK